MSLIFNVSLNFYPKKEKKKQGYYPDHVHPKHTHHYQMSLRDVIKSNETNGNNKIPWLRHNINNNNNNSSSSSQEEEKGVEDEETIIEPEDNNEKDDSQKEFKEVNLLKQIYDLFLWEDVPTSCYAFVVSNAVFCALVKLKISLPALLCQFSIMSIALSFALGYGSTLICRHLMKNDKMENPTDAFANTVEVPREWITRTTRLVGRAVTEFAEFVKSLIMHKNTENSLKAGGIFLVLGLLSQKYSATALLWLAINFCFIWFPVYKYQRESVDKYYDESLEFAVAHAKTLKEDSTKLVKKYLQTQ